MKQKIQDDPIFSILYKRNPCEYNRFFNLISSMLEYDPSKRLRPMECLKHPFFVVLSFSLILYIA